MFSITRVESGNILAFGDIEQQRHDGARADIGGIPVCQRLTREDPGIHLEACSGEKLCRVTTYAFGSAADNHCLLLGDHAKTFISMGVAGTILRTVGAVLMAWELLFEYSRTTAPARPSLVYLVVIASGGRHVPAV